MRHTFNQEMREDLWLWSRGAWRHLEVRMGAGRALTVLRDGRWEVDAEDGVAALPVMSPPPAAEVFDEALVRIVTDVRSVEKLPPSVLLMVSVTVNSASVTVPVAHVADAVAMLRRTLESSGEEDVDPHGLPILWRNGSAAVLLHEAVGHAAEAGCGAVAWPSWLRVTDEPLTDFDDTGRECAEADLTAGEPPTAYRRESFRHIPLRRMSHVVVRGSHAVPLPVPRVEVTLVGGGDFDPRTDRLSLRLRAAEMVTGSGRARLRSSSFTVTRQELAKAIIGAQGGLAEYPGVICSLEGQRLWVRSSAPDLLTGPLR